MENDTDEIEKGILAKKAQYYYENHIMVHLKFKNGLFKNGYITEIGADFFFFDDRRLGNMIVFFLELLEIEKYEVIDGEPKAD